MKDFRAVGVISFDSNALVVNPAIPVKTIQELLQYAKDNPGKLSSGATLGIGPHVSLELLRARTGSNMNFIPYRGAAPAITDLLGNQIQVGMSSKAVMLPLINEGKLRALAVTSDERWPELPDVPTLRESNFEGIPALLWSGLLAPAHTPTAVVDKLNAAINDGMKTPSVQASLAKLGLRTRALNSGTVRRRAGGRGPHLAGRRQRIQREARLTLTTARLRRARHRFAMPNGKELAFRTPAVLEEKAAMHLARLALVLGIALTPGMAQAQDAWPSRAITFIVPYAPGGYTDLVARLTARYVEKSLGKPVIVENRARRRRHRGNPGGRERRAGRLHVLRLQRRRRVGRSVRAEGRV